MTPSERAAQIWAVLSLAAKNRQVLTYEIIARSIGVPTRTAGKYLRPIQGYCRQRRIPLLNTLVVDKNRGVPGNQFIAAKYVPREQAKIFNFDWGQYGVPSPEDLEAASQWA